MTELWNGFKCEEFVFEGFNAKIVFPQKPDKNRNVTFKVEYWNAFPDVEIKLLEKGFHLVYIKNISRFATDEECRIKSEFLSYVSEKYNLNKKCVPVGMSCGGAHAVRFAGLYPNQVKCMYIDAPVLNYCSFPGKTGDEECENIWEKEFIKAYPGIKRSKLLNFPEHPLNQAESLVENNIPVLMVYGTEDKSVVYEENGLLLEDAMEGSGLLKTIRVDYRGHHPHGLVDDNTPIIDFIISNT
ncbi:MAG: hypothetical protein IKC01_06420 [Clostridia bacterium]|nr:hypothetical protein [Clostridia bacterium]